MNKKIQILRAISAFAVVMIHSNAEGTVIAAINRPLINFAVAMFIFCSGYLTKTKIDDIKSFYARRLSHTLIPYVIWSVVYAYTDTGFDNFWRDLLTSNCCPMFYFLFAYAQLVLLAPLIGKLITSKYRWVGWFISPVYIFIYRYVLMLFLHIPVTYPFNAVFFPIWFSYYYIGMALGNNIIKFNWSFKKTWAVYAITAVASIGASLYWFYCTTDYDMVVSQFTITSIATSITSLFLAHLFITDEKIVITDNWFTKLLVKIGDRSFGIYLTHWFIMILLAKIPGVMFTPYPFSTILIFTVTTLFVCAAHKLLGDKISRYVGL